MGSSSSIYVPLGLAVLPILLFLPFLVSGIGMAWRRDCVPKSGLALASFAVAGAMAGAAGVLALFAYFGRQHVETLQMIINVAAVIGWSAVVVAVVASIQALIVYRRRAARNEFFEGGTWALHISLVGALTLGALALWCNLKFSRGLEIAPQEVAAGGKGAQRVTALKPVTPELASAENMGALDRFAGASSPAPRETDWFGNTKPAAASPSDGPSVLEFRRLNVRFRRPEDGWIRVDAHTMNKVSTIAYERPSQQFFMIAERVGVENPLTLEDLLEVVRTNQRDAVSHVEFAEPEDLTIAGIAGRLIGSSYRNGHEQVAAQTWAGMLNGYSYQLFLIGRADRPKKIRDAAVKMFSNLEQMDPHDVAHTAAFAASARKRLLPEFGCTVDLSDTPWRVWSDHADDMAASEYGARIDADTFFIVAPVRLTVAPEKGDGPASALVTMAGLNFSTVNHGERRELKQSGLDGTEWTWRQPLLSGEEAEWKVRVFVTPQVAYLLLGAAPAGKADRVQAVGKALDAVLFAPSLAILQSSAATRQREKAAHFYNQLALYHYYDEEWDRSERYFREALNQVPNDPTYLGNLIDVLEKAKKPIDALALIPPGKFSDEPLHLRAMRARLAAAAGKPDDARREYGEVFAAGYRNDRDFRRYIELLDAANQFTTSLFRISQYRRSGDSPDLAILEAESIERSGDAAAAADKLAKQLPNWPNDEDVTYKLVTLYRKQERYTAALAVIEQVAKSSSDQLSAYYWKGLLEFDLQKYKEAKVSLERAHKIDPDHAGVKNLLDHVTAALGEGENLRIKTPIEAVPFPLPPLAKTPAPADFARAAASYVERATVFRFQPSEELTRTEYYYVDIHDQQGVAEFNTLTTRFDPLAEEIYVNRLEVFDENRKLLAAGKTADYYVLDDTRQSMAVHDKILEMPVPGLQPGCRLELVVTVRRISAPEHFPHRAHIFALGYPCRRETTVVVGDEKHLVSAGTLAADMQRGDGYVWWQSLDRPAFRSEPYSPDLVDAEQTLVLADKRASWADETKEYLDEIADRLTIPEVIRRTAAEQTKGLTDRPAKIAALADFVRRTVSYKAVEFGRRARVMHAADRTLNARYGDCKDMSLLLVQLLEAAGVPARPALVHSENPAYESIATLDQFDHMIVYLPDAADPRAVDPTDRYGDPTMPVPLRLAGKKLFAVDGKESRFVALPKLDPRNYRAELKRRVKYDDVGAAHVDETITFFGYYASGMRDFLTTYNAEQRRDRWQSYLQSGEVSLAVRQFALDDLERRERPLVMRTEYDVERALLPTADGWLGTIPAPLELMAFSADAVEKRRLPLDVHYPMLMQTETIVEPPPKCRAIAPESAELKTELMTCRTTASAEDAVLKWNIDLVRSPGRKPAETYEAFVRDARRIRHAASPVVQFVKQP